MSEDTASLGAPTAPSPPPDTNLLGGRWRGYAVAVLFVGAATGLSRLGGSYLALPDVVMLYLLAIVLVATRTRLGPALFAAALSVASYDFFFIPPLFTFVVDDARNILTFVMMFLVGIAVSVVTLRFRRQEQEARLREERAEAATMRARSEEMRSSMLSAVSHDLRTPLAAITGAASALREDSPNLSGEQRHDLLDTIADESERMERLIANLLDMMRFTSGGVTIRREWVPLEEVVGSALARTERRLAGRAVTTDLPAGLPLVPVDSVFLELVFVNLLENAIKYTPAGTSIAITARAERDAVLVEVADQGQGIPPEDREKIFEKFQRGTHPGVAGVGLGLPICRAIVQAHGGTLVVADSPRGALFRFTLPLVGDPPPLPAESSTIEATA